MSFVVEEAEKNWDISNNEEIYWMKGWSDGYFDINSFGNVTVNPYKSDISIDLYELTKALVERGIEAPILLRFDGIIKDRIKRLYTAFSNAIVDFAYGSSYQPVFPVKVNEQRHVIDVIRESGKEQLLGLEVGSKPELLAVLSIHDAKGAVLLCNGYKDREYIELALLARKIGRKSIIIIEQFYELDLILEVANSLHIEAEIGFRIKPFAKGSGKWASSSGELAKFGLSTHEILQGIESLKKANKTHWLKLLHFHIGSQLTSIVPLKKVLREAARMYTELAKACPYMEYFDVGGGLGIDYDGSRTTSDCSMNYTIDEYARDVVYAISEACKKEKIAPPIIISESGRAIAAHHSILITEVIDVTPAMETTPSLEKPPSNHELIVELMELYEELSSKNCLETLNDAYFLKEVTINKFIQGSITLSERAYIERLFYQLLGKITLISKELDWVPKDIKQLENKLLDLYFCNFSVFQSLPDAWAIDQLFPVMPIHRLQEKPTKKAIVVDVSCDSDGTIDKFVNPRGPQKFLPLHEFTNSPYYLGIFLIGAYQEILGGYHNLFGDTNVVHVGVDETGNWQFQHEIEGDTINEVLAYAQYSSADLMERLRISIERALKEGSLTNEESAALKKKFKRTLDSYTYLVV